MNRTIFALLFSVLLTGNAQGCGWNTLNMAAEAVAEVQNNPLPAQASGHSNRQHGERGSAAGQTNTTQPKLAISTAMYWTHKIKSFLDTRLIQENCLTTAIYFEARSESQLGQLAVATVILNRVISRTLIHPFAGSLQGRKPPKRCQFSFACDGKADVVDDKQAWKTASEVTTLALNYDMEVDKGPMQILATATNYHADYVDPVWSKSLNRLTKIGRHIFYSRTSFSGAKGIRKSYI